MGTQRVFRGIAVSLGLLFGLLVGVGAAQAEEIEADPSSYRDLIDTLQPGDTLVLAAGEYDRRMTLRLHGTPDAWITIKGPENGPPARILGDPSICCNTIEIRSGSYLALENLLIDGRNIHGIFAISASGSNIHHIRVENCTIVGHGAQQSTVAISTKTPTWGWIIRRNTIVAAGTGMYLGNSNGTLAFVGGLIENNLFLDSKGYNAQIKHQNVRELVPGMPTGPQRTIIRHNVFIKGDLPSESGVRPNLLLGGFPDSGPGSEDSYEVYGNFFFHNHREALLQAEGRVIIHDNVFADSGSNSGIYLAHQNKTLKVAYVFNNTFYSVERGVRFADLPTEDHACFGNLIFGDAGVTGSYTNAFDNIVDSVANASSYVRNPSVVLGEMDFYPLPGRCEGTPLDLSAYAAFTDFDLDFNGDPKGAATFRGAYAGNGTNPGWQLTDAIKPIDGSPPPPNDTSPPQGSIAVRDDATTTTDLEIDLVLSASDGDSGMGPGAQMRFSNDGTTWSVAEPYARTQTWRLDLYGGNADTGLKTVFVEYRDAAGNWSTASITASVEYAGQGGGGTVEVSSGGGGASGAGILLLLAGAIVVRAVRRLRRLFCA